jgi:hypothetical protein
MDTDDWRTDVQNAPQDGCTIIVPIETSVRAFWCRDLRRWVLNTPLHVESVESITRFRLEGTRTA